MIGPVIKLSETTERIRRAVVDPWEATRHAVTAPAIKLNEATEHIRRAVVDPMDVIGARWSTRGDPQRP